MTIPNQAQIVVFIGHDGTLRAEAPGLNGMRQKIELPICDAELFYATIKTELQSLQARIDARNAEIKLAASVKRQDAEVERHKKNQEIAAARAAEYKKWYDSLSDEQQVKEDARVAKIKERSDNVNKSRAHSVYETCATDHGIDLANRVIRDPKRRPRKRIILSDGRIISAQGKVIGKEKQKYVSDLKDAAVIDFGFGSK